MDPATSSVSERIVQQVAAETNTDQLDLPPLYDAIDPDALENVVGTMADGEVSFAYAGTKVSVDSSGAIHVTENPITVTRDTHWMGVGTSD